MLGDRRLGHRDGRRIARGVVVELALRRRSGAGPLVGERVVGRDLAGVAREARPGLRRRVGDRPAGDHVAIEPGLEREGARLAGRELRVGGCERVAAARGGQRRRRDAGDVDERAGDVGDAAGEDVGQGDVVGRGLTGRDQNRERHQIAGLGGRRRHRLVDRELGLDHRHRARLGGRQVGVARPGELGTVRQRLARDVARDVEHHRLVAERDPLQRRARVGVGHFAETERERAAAARYRRGSRAGEGHPRIDDRRAHHPHEGQAGRQRVDDHGRRCRAPRDVDREFEGGKFANHALSVGVE